ncbi:MAG TPA: Ig-like domain-containing protein [Terriglobales bacterium]|nr:Ig-like domain-containing protein [Terriglobales bacterium]
MHSSGRKLGLIILLSFLSLAGGCTGFFVNPTLSSLTIGPQDQTITVNPKVNLQMSATGQYSDGSTQDLTGKVLWSSSDTTCATINSAGLVSPVSSVSGICTTTISASYQTASAATTTVTVSEGTPTSINLTVSNNSPSPGTSITFTANGTFPGSTTPQDISSSVTWVVSDTTNVPLAQGSGTVIIPASATAEQVTVQASFDGVTSNVVTITIQ